MATSETIGIIAGSGQLPLLAAENARAQGHHVVGIGHAKETDPLMESYCSSFHLIKLGQLGKIFSIFKKEGVTSATFAGAISRPNIFKGNIWLDTRGFSLLAKARSVKDDQLLRAVANEFEVEGIKIFSATDLLPECVPNEGLLTSRDLNADEYDDAELGWETAKLIGKAEIGQTVVVSAGMVVAVEAIEGTDAAIKRAGELSQGKGGVVVKVSKPQQDLRLDLPTVGVDTIKAIKNAGLSALILEAKRSIILEPMKTISLANEFSISIRVYKNGSKFKS